MTGEVLWQMRGRKTIISCVRNGRHFAVWYTDRESGKERRSHETFGEWQAWERYWNAVHQMMQIALFNRGELPETGNAFFDIDGERVELCGIGVDEVEELRRDWCAAHDTSPEQMTEDERHDFALTVAAYYVPEWMISRNGNEVMKCKK